MQKTVLVTGCSSGIGLESALDLTRQGFRVLAACRKAEDVARMQELGLTGILLDLDDPQSVERAAAEVIALTDNRLYGLFNNAGYGVYGPLNTISRQQMEQQFSANFFGAHQLTMLLLPAMISKRFGPSIGRTTMGCTTPCDLIESASSCRVSAFMSTLGW